MHQLFAWVKGQEQEGEYKEELPLALVAVVDEDVVVLKGAVAGRVVATGVFAAPALAWGSPRSPSWNS